MELTVPSNSVGLAKGLYIVAWFVVVPGLLAAGVLWAAARAGLEERSGLLAQLASFAHEQSVPAWIVAFTVFEMVIWGLRFHLPLSRYAYPPARADLPESMRAPFERARILLDEVAVLRAKRGAATHEGETRPVDAAIASLNTAMSALPFDEDAFLDALVRLDEEVSSKLGHWRKSEAREYSEAIIVAVLIAFGLRAFVVEAFKIPSGSMIPTLQVGDHIFVNKFSYGPAIPLTTKRMWNGMPPHRGDVIVFAYPENKEQDFIKRVIAVPGDRLETRMGHPIINGWEVPSCRVGTYAYNEAGDQHSGELFVEYLGEQAYLTFYDKNNLSYSEHQGPYFAGPGEVWVMGDSRNNSHDSRLWNNGRGAGVPFGNIRGRALFVWLSAGPHGWDFSRIGTAVMGRPRLPDDMRGLEPALKKCFDERPSTDKTYPPDRPTNPIHAG